MDAKLKERLRKRIPAYLMLIGMVVIIVQYWQKGPGDVVVRYVLGASAEGLSSATMRYQRGAERYAKVRFDFERKPAAPSLTHKVRLADGDYRVAVELVYGGGKRTVRVERPLLVRGSGSVIVYLDQL